MYFEMVVLRRWLLLVAAVFALSLEGPEAFLQANAPSASGLRNMSIMKATTIMSTTADRRAFAKHLGNGAVGALGVGLATERAAAYEKEYLKEPTAEFKAMEAKQTEFAAAQRAYKQEFVKLLDVRSVTDMTQAFLASKSDEDAVSTLNALSRTVTQRGGLPESVRINDLLKTCRRKKAEMKDSGKWSTPVQVAYETLVQVTNKTVIPLQSGA